MAKKATSAEPSISVPLSVLDTLHRALAESINDLHEQVAAAPTVRTCNGLARLSHTMGLLITAKAGSVVHAVQVPKRKSPKPTPKAKRAPLPSVPPGYVTSDDAVKRLGIPQGSIGGFFGRCKSKVFFRLKGKGHVRSCVSQVELKKVIAASKGHRRAA